MNQETAPAEVRQICARHHIEIQHLESTTGSFYKRIYFINQKMLLRLSETPMTPEQEKFQRVAALPLVPKILHTGEIAHAGQPLYYTLLTLLPGRDFDQSYAEISPSQQAQFGQAVARFLDGLHALTGTHYDIGLYIPIIPQFSGAWRAGHQRYWEILAHESAALPLQPQSRAVFDDAFRFLRDSASALDFQAGPKLLHNDFHPKNLLLHQGQFSGVIDWECSQFGEADFELCHLIHWCVYPPDPGIDYSPFLRALFRAAPRCAQVPNLAERLTIYQIEHEVQQIVWQGSGAEALRVPRLAHWMAGGVADLLRAITEP